MPRRNLIICPFFSPNTGGVETFLDDLMLYLNKTDEFIDVITYQPLTSDKKAPVVEIKNHNRIFRLPWPRFNLFYKLEKYPFLQLIYLSVGIGFFSFLYFLSGEGSKIRSVSCHGLSAGFIGFLLSSCFKKKFILNLHTNYRFSKNSIIAKFVKLMSGRYSRVLVLSDAAKDNLVELGIDSQLIVTYHNWINEDLFSLQDRNTARSKLGLDYKAFYALFVGRFSKEKGIIDLVASLPYLDENINLIIIGGGLFEKEVTKEVKRYKNRFYLGRKTPEELVDFFNAADILVYAPVDEDYLGRVAISALNCGLPLMVPDESAYLGHNKKALLVIPKEIGVMFENNSRSFAAKLNDIYKNKINYEFSREACTRYVNKFYSREVNSRIIYELLHN